MSEALVINPEQERTTLTWGRGVPTRGNHSRELSCLNERCDLNGKWETDRNMKNTVGVKKAPYPCGQKESGTYREYSQMICCPECEQIFWNHLDDNVAKRLLKEKFGDD